MTKSLNRTLIDAGPIVAYYSSSDHWHVVPADFADLSLIVVSDRIGLTDIVTLDSDFDVYRRLRNKPFKRLFPQ